MLLWVCLVPPGGLANSGGRCMVRPARLLYVSDMDTWESRATSRQRNVN